VSKFPEITIVQKVPGEGHGQGYACCTDLIASRLTLTLSLGLMMILRWCSGSGRVRGLQGKIKIVGFDATPEACRAIREGKALIADIAQFPKEIGKSTMETIAEYLKGVQVPPVKYLPVKLITREILYQKTKS
jgi:hypothetical protein